MQSPFLIARFAFFALLVHLNLTTLIFASWNVAAVKASGESAPGAAVFLIYNSLMLFLGVGLSCLEKVWPSLKTRVGVECIWVGLLSVIEFIAAITTTLTEIPRIHLNTDDWGVWASSSLLIPLAWLSNFALVLYFLILVITAFGHLRDYPVIWSTSIYALPWLTPRDPSEPTDITRAVPAASGDGSSTRKDSAAFKAPSTVYKSLWGASTDDLEKGSIHTSKTTKSIKERFLSPLSKRVQIRRGVDPPFATHHARKPTLKSDIGRPQMNVPAVPPEAYIAKRVAPPRQQSYYDPDSVYSVMEVPQSAELPLEEPEKRSTMQVAPIYARFRGVGYHPGGPMTGVSGAFAPVVHDEDEPIVLPRLSEWVRADHEKGINVHSRPPISP